MNEQDIIKKLSQKYNKKENLIKCMIEEIIKNDKETIKGAESIIMKFFNQYLHFSI